MARLQVRVAAGNARTAVDGWIGDTLKLRVRAPPEKGRANRAVLELLAARLGCPKGCIRIVAGATSRDKVVEVAGWSDSGLQGALC
ncbi:MAG: DUF167 domain-containing protein [Thioalkalivibrio sp.]|nr:DUF167 domain-containing protein [Thioalkalivibrio sp.]